jgi:hypothetical protein
MLIKDRIKLYLKTQNIGERNFCKTIGVSHGYVSSMRVSLQPDKIERISELYPDLNITWLLTGEGNMLNKSKKSKKTSDKPISNDQELENLYLMLKEKDQIILELKRELKNLYALNPGIKKKPK